MRLQRRRCGKDRVISNAVFREYVDNSATKFLTKIFNKKYSVVKRLFWLIVFLGAAALFLLNAIERVQLLISSPTSTAFSSARVKPATFPAVTICNLNRITKSGLQDEGLLEAAKKISGIGNLETNYLNNCESVIDMYPSAEQVTIDYLKRTAIQPSNNFIEDCKFLGLECDVDSNFERTAYSYGMCYTFNSYNKVPTLQTNGTGSHHGLYLTVNISQNEYIGSDFLDAGVKIFVHPTTEPARVLDQGIAIPPGRVLYAGMQQQDVINEAKVGCVANRDNSHYNFLGNIFNYSEHGCLQDCLLTEIAIRCNCYYIKTEIPPSNPAYANIRDCTFADICCIERVSVTNLNCNCPLACESTTYDLTTSYSSYPALYDTEDQNRRQDFLEVSVYFQTLVVSKETTSFSYTFIGLLSDIGGLLGLYLGIGIISFVEFIIWILDELLERLCCFKISCQKKKEDKGYRQFEMDSEGKYTAEQEITN